MSFSGILNTSQRKENGGGGIFAGARNGTSQDADNYVVLGGDPGSGDGVLLNDREIDLSGFGLSVYNDDSQVSFFGDNTGMYLGIQTVDPDKRAEFNVDNGFDGSARFGAFAANDNDFPNVAYLLSGTTNEFRIGNDSGGASTAFVSFYNIAVERARISPEGTFLIGKTVGSAAYKLDVAQVSASTVARFSTNGASANGTIQIENTSAAVAAGAGMRIFNDVGLGMQWYFGSSTNSFVPNGFLLDNLTTGPLRISNRGGEIQFATVGPNSSDVKARLLNAGNFLVGRAAVSGLTTGVSVEVGADNAANPGRFISYGASLNERFIMYSGATNNRSASIGMRSVGPNAEMFFYLNGAHGGSMIPTTNGASLVFEAFTIGDRADGSKRIQASDQGVLTVGSSANPTVAVEKLIVASSRAVFRNDVFCVGLRAESNSNTAPCWLGATNSLTPDMLFSNAAGVEQFRVSNTGGVSTDGGTNKWKFRAENASIVVPDRSVEIEINGNIYNIPAFLAP